jgi:hypothetical protein
MKTVNYIKLGYQLFRLIIPAILLCALAERSYAQISPPGGDSGPTNTPLDSWSFQDNTNWTDDESNAPISFTNIAFAQIGDGFSLVVNTNVAAWLNYNVYEPGTGATNLVVNGPGSLIFWYAPADWSSTNAGGTGPGQWVQLMDVGQWGTNGSSSYWGLSLDPPGTNLWFVSQDGLGDTYSLSAPVSLTTNYFHFIALTCSATNVSLFWDGQLLTNDTSGLSIWPDSEVISNGIYFGSDPNGQMQAAGLFNLVASYNYPLDSNDVQSLFNWYYPYYMITPWNMAMDINQAPSDPSTNFDTPDVITGPGNLQQVGTVTAISSTNVWITNVVVTASAGTMTLTFTVQGGSDGLAYDVFANSVLDFSSDTNKAWAWEGQTYHGNRYELSGLPGTACFLILGTPQDTDSDGLTDAYERLVSKSNPNNPDTDGAGISDGWQVLLGLNPLVNQVAQPGTRSNYGYTLADWLNQISGIKIGNVISDNEGNVQTVSQ